MSTPAVPHLRTFTNSLKAPESDWDVANPAPLIGSKPLTGVRAMGDDNEKSVIEKMVDKVNDAVANIVNTASAAAMKAMEPEPDPEQVAGTTNEQVYVPEATDTAAVPAPLFVAPAKKKRAVPKKSVAKAATPKKSAKKSAKRKTAKKTATKASKKAAKKFGAKKTKSSAGRKAAAKKKAKR